MREILTLDKLVQYGTIDFAHNNVNNMHNQALFHKAVDIVCDDLKSFFHNIDINKCKIFIMNGRIGKNTDWAYLNTPFGDCVIDISYDFGIDVSYGYLAEDDREIYYYGNLSVMDAITKGSGVIPQFELIYCAG